jgi:hypothetical protein
MTSDTFTIEQLQQQVAALTATLAKRTQERDLLKQACHRHAAKRRDVSWEAFFKDWQATQADHERELEAVRRAADRDILRVSLKLMHFKKLARTIATKRGLCAPKNSEAGDIIFRQARELETLKKALRQSAHDKREIFQKQYVPHMRAWTHKNEDLRAQLKRERSRLAALEQQTQLSCGNSVVAMIAAVNDNAQFSISTFCFGCSA